MRVLRYAPMASSCPQCGWSPVAGTHCPRCGVDVARYRADLEAASAMPARAIAPTAPPSVSSDASPDALPDASTIAAPPMTEEARRAAAPMAAAAIHPAGFWVRAGAILIDVVLVMVAEVAFGFFLWAVTDDRLATAASRAFRVLASPCYFVFLHWARGQTLGKMAFRIRVVMLSGAPLPFGPSALRHLGSWLSAAILGIGYLLAAFRADKRALHDLIAGTRVEHVT
jgi:uncharacterized RDD family membrane protein YckC